MNMLGARAGAGSNIAFNRVDGQLGLADVEEGPGGEKPSFSNPIEDHGDGDR